MVKNKYIIFPFLLLAWAIIFLHSIIPHHHHAEEFLSACNDCHLHESHNIDKVDVYSCEHDCTDYTCQFQIETFTQIPIDHVYILNSENIFLNDLYFTETRNINFYVAFDSDQSPKIKFLRGPPVIA